MSRSHHRIAAVLVCGSLLLVVAPAAAAAKPRSCKRLTPAQMSDVLEVTVKGPGTPGTGGFACSFDIPPGLGEPGGGLVTVTYFKGQLAKGTWKGTKPRTEPVEASSARYDDTTGAAWVFRKGKLAGVAVAYTGNEPPASSLLPQIAELAERAAGVG